MHNYPIMRSISKKNFFVNRNALFETRWNLFCAITLRRPILLAGWRFRCQNGFPNLLKRVSMASAVKGPEIKPSTVKKVIFYPSTGQKCRPLKSFKVFQISLIQLIFTDFYVLKNLQTGKISSCVSKNTLSRHNKTLELIACIWKYFEILEV